MEKLFGYEPNVTRSNRVEDAKKEVSMTKKRKRNIEIKKLTKDCWNLDFAFRKWLEPRLRKYLKDADKIVNLEYYKFTIRNEEKTQKEWILKMIELCDWLAIDDNYFDEHYTDNLQYLGEIWGVVLPTMWW